MTRQTTARPTVDRRGWHLEKRLSIDTLIAVVGLVLGLGGPILFWGRAMESRVLTIEVFNQEQNKIQSQRDAALSERDRVIGSRLDKLEGKLTDVQIQLGVALASRAAIVGH